MRWKGLERGFKHQKPGSKAQTANEEQPRRSNEEPRKEKWFWRRTRRTLSYWGLGCQIVGVSCTSFCKRVQSVAMRSHTTLKNANKQVLLLRQQNNAKYHKVSIVQTKWPSFHMQVSKCSLRIKRLEPSHRTMLQLSGIDPNVKVSTNRTCFYLSFSAA